MLFTALPTEEPNAAGEPMHCDAGALEAVVVRLNGASPGDRLTDMS